MIPEIIRYKIPLDRCDAFIEAYRAAGEVLKRSPHCHGFELLRSAKNAELFLLLIRWDSPEGHLQGFRGSAQFREFFALIKPYVANIEEMEHYAYTEVMRETIVWPYLISIVWPNGMSWGEALDASA